MESNVPMPGGRIPPNHPESERGVLGAMMRSAEAVMLAQEMLRKRTSMTRSTGRSSPPCCT